MELQSKFVIVSALLSCLVVLVFVLANRLAVAKRISKSWEEGYNTMFRHMNNSDLACDKMRGKLDAANLVTERQDMELKSLTGRVDALRKLAMDKISRLREVESQLSLKGDTERELRGQLNEALGRNRKLESDLSFAISEQEAYHSTNAALEILFDRSQTRVAELEGNLKECVQMAADDDDINNLLRADVARLEYQLNPGAWKRYVHKGGLFLDDTEFCVVRDGCGFRVNRMGDWTKLDLPSSIVDKLIDDGSWVEVGQARKESCLESKPKQKSSRKPRNRRG